MNKQFALKLIAFISFGGILFSGYLSYNELFAGGCSSAVISCGTTAVSIASIPVCVYGLAMYVFIFLISITGFFTKDPK
jgi:hypothetical protein